MLASALPQAVSPSGGLILSSLAQAPSSVGVALASNTTLAPTDVSSVNVLARTVLPAEVPSASASSPVNNSTFASASLDVIGSAAATASPSFAVRDVNSTIAPPGE